MLKYIGSKQRRGSLQWVEWKCCNRASSMSLSMCSDVFGHAESVHSFSFLGHNTVKPPWGVGVGVVTTPLHVCGCMAEVGGVPLLLEETQSKCLVLFFFGWSFRQLRSCSASTVFSLPPSLLVLGCYQTANYKCNLANQRCRWSHWENYKLHRAGESIYYHFTTLPHFPHSYL